MLRNKAPFFQNFRFSFVGFVLIGLVRISITTTQSLSGLRFSTDERIPTGEGLRLRSNPRERTQNGAKVEINHVCSSTLPPISTRCYFGEAETVSGNGFWRPFRAGRLQHKYRTVKNNKSNARAVLGKYLTETPLPRRTDARRTGVNQPDF